jgi:hypothetical protein
MRRFSYTALLCSAALLAYTGCNRVPQYTPVSGVVTLDGEPYGNVMVTFVAVDGGGVSPVGRTDDSGKFKMGTDTSDNGVRPGKYKVVVAPGPSKESKGTGHPSEAFQGKQPAAGKVDASKEYQKLEKEGAKALKAKVHPTIYGDPARTTLEVDVGSSPKEVKFELKSGAK